MIIVRLKTDAFREDSLCKKDPEFLSILPAQIKGKILKIWAEDIKDYRFYGEENEEAKDFDTEERIVVRCLSGEIECGLYLCIYV